MKALAIGAAVAAALATLALGAALFLRPGERGFAVDAYLLLVGALVLLVLVHATRAAGGRAERSRFELALRRRPTRRERLPELAALERQTGLALASAFDVHYRLRPVLQEIARHRLAARRGIALERDGEAARAALGDELWELVRPDREPPRNRAGPGATVQELRAFLDDLERI